MGTAYSKKLLVLYILDILQKYTDEEHRLSQKEILEILRKEYEMIVDRKTVRRNLLNLMLLRQRKSGLWQMRLPLWSGSSLHR